MAYVSGETRQSTFSNTVAKSTGALSFVLDSSSTMNVYDCTFTNNTANKGGGLYIAIAQNPVITERLTFISN